MPVDHVLVAGPGDNDALLAGLRPGSLVVNATGLGKDAPGSPLTDAAPFPERAVAWDLNYRGDLVFLDQARRRRASRGLRVEDGWTYFLHGWTRVIAEVFQIEIPTAGPPRRVGRGRGTRVSAAAGCRQKPPPSGRAKAQAP